MQRLISILGSLSLGVVSAAAFAVVPVFRSTRAAVVAAVGIVTVAASLACAACVSDGGGNRLFGAVGRDGGPDLDVATDDVTSGDDAATAPVWPGPAADAAGVRSGVDATAPSGPSPSPSPSPPINADSGAESGDSSAELDAPSSFEPDASCVQPVGPGLLVIDELMIESVAGTGDYGEWLEIHSTASCALNLNGLHGQCPVGAKLHTFDITSDTWLLPSGTFVVADVGDPAINHDLPAPVITWAGQPGDVLRNLGGTVTLTLGDSAGTIVDSVTFPSLKPKVGASIAFPSNCPASRRSDWTAWQTSTASWFPGFYGTPNAPNDDVSCP